MMRKGPLVWAKQFLRGMFKVFFRANMDHGIVALIEYLISMMHAKNKFIIFIP